MPVRRRLPAGVWVFGWISFVTDTASEAIYPLLPVYLTGLLGAGPFALGLIEGVADATANLLKLVAGRVSDRLRRRRPIVIAGYALASVVRPLVSVAGSWPQVLVVRFADRVGKGIRGAPRDAMLAAMAPPGERARVFGVQRAMDHAGAVVGPLLASAYLWWKPGDYRTLFAATIVPGLLVVALLRRLPADEGVALPASGTAVTPAANPLVEGLAWRDVPGRVYAVLGVLFLFTLGNSTDAYLLLRLADAGVPAASVPLAWAALHVVKSTTSVMGGWVADRFDRRVALCGGWAVYAAVYAGFATVSSPALLLACFLAYGLYFGLTEGTEKALLTDLAPGALRGTVFGLHGAATGVGLLAASLVCGAVWQWRGPGAAFGFGAVMALLAFVLIWPAAAVRRPAA